VREVFAALPPRSRAYVKPARRTAPVLLKSCSGVPKQNMEFRSAASPVAVALNEHRPEMKDAPASAASLSNSRITGKT
jgi:hypothetical protein